MSSKLPSYKTWLVSNEEFRGTIEDEDKEFCKNITAKVNIDCHGKTAVEITHIEELKKGDFY